MIPLYNIEPVNPAPEWEAFEQIDRTLRLQNVATQLQLMFHRRMRTQQQGPEDRDRSVRNALNTNDNQV